MLLLWIIISVAGICCIVTILNCLFWPCVQKSVVSQSRLVSVLIPARNEEQNLASCLEAALKQGRVVTEILIYDDHSVDTTPQIIQTYAAKYSIVKSVPAVSLHPGWCGKNFACAQLAAAAQGEWLLFLDADARLTSQAVGRMLAEAQKRQVTFLSCWPELEMRSYAEKILMPLLNFVVFSIYPTLLTSIKSPSFQFNPKLGLAHGACMLFERDSYDAFGGHEKVKDQIFEDTRFAQLWRTSRRACICLDGQGVVSLRMYKSFREIWGGFQKNFFPAFQHESNFWLFLLLHTLVFFLPFWGGIISKAPLLVLISILVLLMRLLLVFRFKHSLLSVLFHPFGEMILVLLGLSSWWRCKTGKGVVWKGRAYQKSI